MKSIDILHIDIFKTPLSDVCNGNVSIFKLRSSSLNDKVNRNWTGIEYKLNKLWIRTALEKSVGKRNTWDGNVTEL